MGNGHCRYICAWSWWVGVMVCSSRSWGNNGAIVWGSLNEGERYNEHLLGRRVISWLAVVKRMCCVCRRGRLRRVGGFWVDVTGSCFCLFWNLVFKSFSIASHLRTWFIGRRMRRKMVWWTSAASVMPLEVAIFVSSFTQFSSWHWPAFTSTK
jgi:hypothetical protein